MGLIIWFDSYLFVSTTVEGFHLFVSVVSKEMKKVKGATEGATNINFSFLSYPNIQKSD